MYRFHSSMVERPHSIREGPGSIPGRCSSIFGIWREVLGRKHTHIMYRFHSSMVERPNSIGGTWVRFPDDAVQYLAFGEKYWDVMYTLRLLGRIVYITSQYFFPAIIYRDIISHITITYRYTMYFFRTFKKSTAPYNVHNMGLRYIKSIYVNVQYLWPPTLWLSYIFTIW
jgi:hypothetical protein